MPRTQAVGCLWVAYVAAFLLTWQVPVVRGWWRLPAPPAHGGDSFAMFALLPPFAAATAALQLLQRRRATQVAACRTVRWWAVAWKVLAGLVALLVGHGYVWFVLRHRDSAGSALAGELANGVVNMGLPLLSLLLIPTDQSAVLLGSLGLSFEQTVCLHRWLGRLVTALAAVHGVTWLVLHVAAGGSLVPSMACFGGLHYEAPCYSAYLTSTGLVAVLLLALVGLSSLPALRRKTYRLFYLAHLCLTPLTMLAMALHYPRFTFWVAPGLALYLATRLPALLPALAPARAVAPQRVFRIGAGVLGLQFPCSALAHLPAPGQWVRVRCAALSSVMWHPLSVAQCDGGAFTVFLKVEDHPKTWSRALRASPVDRMRFSFLGPYGRDLLACSRAHSTVVLVAGGIGITPLLALAAGLRSRHRRGDAAPQAVTLVWATKDFSLLSYINPMLSALTDCPTISFKVSLSFTGSGWASQAPESVPDRTLELWPDHPGPRTMWPTLLSTVGSPAAYAGAAWGCHTFLGGDEGHGDHRAGILWDATARFLELLGAMVAALMWAALCSWMGGRCLARLRSPLAQQDMCLAPDTNPLRPESPTSAPLPIFPGRPELECLLEEAAHCNRAGPVGVFVCGPAEMVTAVKQYTSGVGARSSQWRLYTETFTW